MGPRHELLGGAIGAIGVRYLAPEDSTSVAVFGSGTQGHYQALALAAELDPERITFYSRSGKKHDAVRVVEDAVTATVTAAETATDACQGADIVVATNASTPVYDDADLKPGALVIGVGSNNPERREIPGKTMVRAEHVYVDDYTLCMQVGDVADAMAEGRSRPTT